MCIKQFWNATEVNETKKKPYLFHVLGLSFHFSLLKGHSFPISLDCADVRVYMAHQTSGVGCYLVHGQLIEIISCKLKLTTLASMYRILKNEMLFHLFLDDSFYMWLPLETQEIGNYLYLMHGRLAGQHYQTFISCT
jgi:hypothetical protein